MTLYKWLQAPGSNANSDPTINWAEGQAPSTVNDSARAMMAAIAKYRDDAAGAIVTGGAVNAYTVASNQVFDTLAHLNGQMIAFTPHVTNTSAVLLSVDGLGGKPLRTSPNVDLQSGVLIQGTPYVAVYNTSDGAFYLRGVGPAPGIPLGASIDYWGTSAPTSFFALAYGQAISRTTYASLFSQFGATYGTGDGTTTFNVPDLRGRVVAGKDDMGGSTLGLIGSLTTDNGTIIGTVLGSKGGTATHALTAGQIPSLTSSGSNSISVSGTALNTTTDNGSIAPGTNGGFAFTSARLPSTITSTGSNNIIVSYTNSSQSGVVLLPPTIIANKLLRVL
jgi:microcystin-dependent protein